MMLLDQEVQNLFAGYEYVEKVEVRKKSKKTTHNTESEQVSLRVSGR